MLDIEKYRDILFSCTVSAGMSSYWSELASVSTLENLLGSGQITLRQYLERIPEGYIARRDELIEECQNMTEEVAV